MQHSARKICDVTTESGLEALLVASEPLLAEIRACPPADRSEQVRRALEKLDHCEEVHFGLLGGLGFRALQARNAALAFENVRFVVHLDTCSQVEREKQSRWPSGPDELFHDYMERYCYEYADTHDVRGISLDKHIQTQRWQHRHQAQNVEKKHPLVTVGIAHFNLGRYLPEALQSLVEQTYRNLEVIVVDDGSTEAASIEAIAKLEREYPRFRFLRQPNGGIGAARNRLLAEARGEFFIPMDADNIARPAMVETFVKAIGRNPDLSAMTCYFHAFADEAPDRFIYAHRPTGGPHSLACIRNVYGDANGIFRTADFREVGGYETDRGTSCEDWEAYVKLIHAGKRIDVIPEYLFLYRHREAGFSRATNWFANHQRVLRQFDDVDQLPTRDAAVVWIALLGFHRENVRLNERLRSFQYRAADVLISPLRWLKRFLKRHS